jgi:hypothetical protein
MLRVSCILAITMMACSGQNAGIKINTDSVNSQSIIDDKSSLAESEKDTSGNKTRGLDINNGYRWIKLADSAP